MRKRYWIAIILLTVLPTACLAGVETAVPADTAVIVSPLPDGDRAQVDYVIDGDKANII